MKRAYNSPEMHWVPVCSNSAVADVCWVGSCVLPEKGNAYPVTIPYTDLVVGFGESCSLSDRFCCGFCSFSGGEHYDY